MCATPDPAAAPTGSPRPNTGAAAGDGPAEGPITADPALDTDDESQADTASVSSSASLTESITEYRRLHGRTYTQKTDYYGPNDEKQNEGLEIKLFLSPIGDNPQRVLDVGTGTGIWAIDFADEFPSAEVYGIDISPIQPGWVPPNCKFQIDDIEKMPWSWPAAHFDFVHIRNLEGCVSDWPALYTQAFEILQPGVGYIEVKETDFEVRSQVIPDLDDEHPFKRWAKVMFEAFDKMGKTARQHRDHGIRKNLEAAGFVDIVEKTWPIPIGNWARDPKLKEVGFCHLEFLDQSLEGFGTFLLKEIMGWEYAEILVFMSEMRRELKNAKIQPKIDIHLVYARKPEQAKE